MACRVLEDWGLDGTSNDTTLVLSELVTMRCDTLRVSA